MILLIMTDLLIPVIMIIGGYFMKYRTPKTINGYIGYRTSMSIINQDTWKFAHNYCGGLWIRLGAIMFAVSAAGSIISVVSGYVVASIVCIVLIVIQTIILIGSILPTEKELLKHFDQKGNKIN